MTGHDQENILQKLVRIVSTLLVLSVGIRIAADVIQPVLPLVVVLFIVVMVFGVILQGPRFRR